MWFSRMRQLNDWYNEGKQDKQSIYTHIFRHSFTTRLYETGVFNLKQMADLIGHADEQTIKRYIHSDKK